MNTRVLLFVLALFVAVPGLATSQEEGKPDMAAMMKEWAKWSETDEHHKEMEYFLGEWTTATKMVMPGAPATDPVPGKAKYAWVIEGRWMGQHFESTMFGKPFKGFGLSGFDRFKKKWVSTWADTSSTALTHVEGVVVDPTGKVQSLYGTIDEFLTGEHDKPARYAIEKKGPNNFKVEIWDLGMGKTGQVVVEIDYARVAK